MWCRWITNNLGRFIRKSQSVFKTSLSHINPVDVCCFFKGNKCLEAIRRGWFQWAELMGNLQGLCNGDYDHRCDRWGIVNYDISKIIILFFVETHNCKIFFCNVQIVIFVHFNVNLPTINQYRGLYHIMIKFLT